MTRNSNALMRDGSVMADSDLVDFLSGSTDSAINFNGSADLHTPIHPPLFVWKVSNQMQFTQVYFEPRYTKLKIQCKKKISRQPT